MATKIHTGPYAVSVYLLDKNGRTIVSSHVAGVSKEYALQCADIEAAQQWADDVGASRVSIHISREDSED